MQVNLIIETNDPGTVWNAFRFANTALDNGHAVETFLLGDGVDAPDLEHEKFNPHGIMRKYHNDGGVLAACGTCMDSRDIAPDELRPRSTMDELLRIVEEGDKVLTFG